MKPHYRYYTFDKRDNWITKVQRHWYLFVVAAAVVIIFVKSCSNHPDFQYHIKQKTSQQ